MIAYVTVGVDDVALAETFYSSFLPRLGYVLEVTPEGLGYAIPSTTDHQHTPAVLYVGAPYDGRAASVGNGTMVAFKVQTQSMVRELHAAALAAGGRDEGEPGFRPRYGAHFYVGYLRDPQGNKVALFCNSRDEPKRPD